MSNGSGQHFENLDKKNGFHSCIPAWSKPRLLLVRDDYLSSQLTPTIAYPSFYTIIFYEYLINPQLIFCLETLFSLTGSLV